MKSDTDTTRPIEDLSRRNVLGVGSAAFATAALSAVSAHAQDLEKTRRADSCRSSSDPAQENEALLDEDPNSNMPPATDRGDVGPIWYSFDLTHKRIQEGGWTHQERIENCLPRRNSPG